MMKRIMKLARCILVLTGCIFFFCGYGQNWDVRLLRSINPQDPHSGVMKIFTNSAYPLSIAAPVGLLTAGFLTKDKQLQRDGWETAGSVVLAAVVTEGLKKVVNRERPYLKYPGEIYSPGTENDPSFPSGHASLAFATATSLTLDFKKWYIAVPAYAWAAGVGYSRLYLGEHYPTDILGSAIVGSGSAVLSHWLTKKIFKNQVRQQ